LLGNYKEGWEDFEYGWMTGNRGGMRLPPHLWWRGEDVERLFVWYEQGFGDNIMFSRFIPGLPAKVKIFEVRKELYRLYAAQPGFADKVTVRPDDLSTGVGYDRHISVHSIPLALGLEKKDIPAEPYLEVPKLGRDFGLPKGRRVGIVLSGDPAHANNVNRSLPMEAAMPLLEGGLGVKWISPALQHKNIYFVGRELSDWADTAQLLDQIDLLVTCDTGIAHLAGALGKPVKLMLCTLADWRWGTDEVQSAWYSSIQIYRQTKPGEWGPVVEAVVKDL
jgi:hypothetical protein